MWAPLHPPLRSKQHASASGPGLRASPSCGTSPSPVGLSTPTASSGIELRSARVHGAGGQHGHRAAGFDRTGSTVAALEIEGFRQRPDADGRLLGHFPYPEVPVDQRVSFSRELVMDAADALDVMQAGLADGVDLVC